MADKYDWLDYKLLQNCIREAREHPTRIDFMRRHNKAIAYYSANNKALCPVDEENDKELEASELYQVAYENRIGKNVDDIVSTSLANYPIVRHYPHSDRPQDGELADNMDAVTEAVWRPDGANLGNAIQIAWKSAVISGLSFGKMYWDSSNQLTGDGQVAGVLVPHSEILVDPYCLNDKRLLDARYIIHVTRHSKAYIRARYGDEGKIALGERGKQGRKSEEATPAGIWTRFYNWTKAELTDALSLGRGGEGAGKDPDAKVEPDQIDVCECWLSPTVTSDSNLVIGNAMARENSQWIVAVMINDHIVRVDSNPYQSMTDISDIQLSEDGESIITGTSESVEIGSRRHPFFCMIWQAVTDKEGRNRIYCCKGAVEPMIPVQVSFNALQTTIQKNALTFANPVAEVIKGAVVNVAPDQMKWKPGDTYIVDPNIARGREAITVKSGAQLPAYVLENMALKMRALTEVSGISEILTGLGSNPQMGTSHTQVGVIASAQQAALRPLVTPLQELERGIYDIACLAEGLMQQNYEEDRIINVSNKGKQLAVKWKKAFLSAQFIRVVVGGSTTPTNDLTRQQDTMIIDKLVKETLMLNNKTAVLSTIITLKNMNKPYAYDYIQLLQKEYDRLEKMEQGQIALGQGFAQQQMQGMNQGEEEAPPDWQGLFNEINSNMR